MRRIERIRLVKLVAAPLGALAVLVIALWGIGREVWVAKVVENMPSLLDVPGMLSFASAAFLHTDLMVQMLAVLLVAATLWLASEVAHILKESLRFA